LKKIWQNFWQYFASSLTNFAAPPKKSVKKLYIDIYTVLQYFHFCQNLEITIFAKILKNVAIFLKDLIFKVEIFAKLSLKYERNFCCKTNPNWLLEIVKGN